MYFALKIESECVIPFLDVLVIRKGMALAFKENSPTVANIST
jgi:hypothetical protein